MRNLVGILGCVAALAIASPAGAQTLVAGDNSLTTQIHTDPGEDSTNTTVYGRTQPGNVQVSFTSDTVLEVDGAGYAAIQDFTPNDAMTFDNLLIQLTNGGGFTDYEFSAQFNITGQDPNAFLTIGYTLIGGGSGSFAFNTALCSACANLQYGNSANRDFRLNAGAGNAFASLYLTSTSPMFEVKQNDIRLAVTNPVPEPSTWAMMLIGFGAAGYGLRRRRRVESALRQVA